MLWTTNQWSDIWRACEWQGEEWRTDLDTIFGGEPLGRKIYAPDACRESHN